MSTEKHTKISKGLQYNGKALKYQNLISFGIGIIVITLSFLFLHLIDFYGEENSEEDGSEYDEKANFSIKHSNNTKEDDNGKKFDLHGEIFEKNRPNKELHKEAIEDLIKNVNSYLIKLKHDEKEYKKLFFGLRYYYFIKNLSDKQNGHLVDSIRKINQLKIEYLKTVLREKKCKNECKNHINRLVEQEAKFISKADEYTLKVLLTKIGSSINSEEKRRKVKSKIVFKKEKTADKKTADKKAADKKTADKKAADKKAADKKAADKKTADKKAADKKAKEKILENTLGDYSRKDDAK